MATPYSVPQNFSTTLNVGGGIDASQTTGIILTSVSGLPTDGGILCFDWSATLDTAVAEYIEYTGISGNTLTGVVRGAEGVSAKAHSNGCTIVGVVSKAHINRLKEKLDGTDTTGAAIKQIIDTSGNEILTFTKITTAVNQVDISNNSTGNNPIMSVAGGDSNIGLDTKMKGTGKWRKPTVVEVPWNSVGTNFATGDGKAMLRIPAELNGMNLTGVAMSIDVAGTTGTMDVQLRRRRSAANVDMLSTKLTIDSTEEDTSTAATAAVINTSNDDVATNDKIYIDVDAVHTTPATGVGVVEMRFELP